MIRRKDEEHLHFATAQNRALYSFNVGDFYEIHTAWTTSGREHRGIVLTQQRRYSTGEQIRRFLPVACWSIAATRAIRIRPA